MNTNFKPVIVALDFPSLEETLALADQLDPAECRVKVGKELYTGEGPASVKALITRGFEVFLDLKFHDIPNTVAGACRSAADLGCWMLNLHVAGGRAMMEAARGALMDAPDRPLLIGVTVLTSLDDAGLGEIGVSGSLKEQVCRLTRLAVDAGLDGVVCSAQEVSLLRSQTRTGFAFVTPGVRLPGDAADDQIRSGTPTDAIVMGATYLVIGRPITKAPFPNEVLLGINEACRIAQEDSTRQRD